MLYPTIEELTRGECNRYQLALATAKCARLITDEYVRQHDIAEKSLTGNKETDRPINTMIDRELRDEKAVRVAIGHIYRGDYVIDLHADERCEKEDVEAAEETVGDVLSDQNETSDAEDTASTDAE